MEQVIESLRDQQKRLARARIIDAAADEIVSTGLGNFSMQSLADRAGVSLRTVYNYFETRDTLIDALPGEMRDRLVEMGEVALERDLFELPDVIRQNWSLWGQLGTLGEAQAIISADRALRSGQRSVPSENTALTQAITDGVRQLDPALDERQAYVTTAAIRLLVSFDAFHRLTHEFDLGPEESGAVTAWAFATLRDALADGRGPREFLSNAAVEHDS